MFYLIFMLIFKIVIKFHLKSFNSAEYLLIESYNMDRIIGNEITFLSIICVIF